jgi:hypothetical protein
MPSRWRNSPLVGCGVDGHQKARDRVTKILSNAETATARGPEKLGFVRCPIPSGCEVQ